MSKLKKELQTIKKDRTKAEAAFQQEIEDLTEKLAASIAEYEQEKVCT